MKMFKRRESKADVCLRGVRNDLWQIGASAAFCNEISSIRQKSQFEELNRSRHLAKDIGLTR